MLKGIGHGDLLTDRAYAEIREAIFAHVLPPGTALSVPELANQLAISRSPVREAVQRLIYDGLAVAVPYKGAAVADLTIDDLVQLFEAREVLEGLAARGATEQLTPSTKAMLEDAVEQHADALKQENLASHIELDMHFHSLIRKAAGNEPLIEILDRLQARVRLAMHSLWGRDDAPRRALEDHKRILAAMLSGDPTAAEAAAKAHIARVRSALIAEAGYQEESGDE
jgi:DNA-binding GntR family transcriptional regulator